MREEQLLKAISDMEAIAKGKDVSPGMSGKGNDVPRTTSQANGGLSGEGDQGEMAVTASSPAYASKGDEEEFDFDSLDSDDSTAKGGNGKKKKSLVDWAKEEEDEEAHKGDYGDDDDESMDDSDSDSGDDDADDEDDDKKVTEKGYRAVKGNNETLADLVKSDASMGPVVDVAPFLERLLDQVSDALENQNRAIADIGQQVNSQQRVLKALGNVSLENKNLLKSFGDQPAGDRRSVLSKSEMVDRFEEAAPDFSKAEVLDAMVDLCQQGKVNPVAVSRYETTNTMEPEIRKSVEGHLLQKRA